MTMKQIGKFLESEPEQPRSDDSNDAIYTLVMHGLCKKYGIESAFEKLVFSTIESMSRGRLCLFSPEKLTKYSGGTVSEVKEVLDRLQGDGIIAQGKANHTNGWKLADDVRQSANVIKAKINRLRKDPKRGN